MLRWIALLLAALLAVAAAAEPRRVVLIGDSITYGLSSKPVGPGFAALLAESLGSGYALVNVSCGGTSSLDWSPNVGNAMCGPDEEPSRIYTARVKPQLPADLAVVMLGTNDAQGSYEPQGPIDAQHYRAAIGELTAALLTDGARRVMLLTPPPLAANVQFHLRLARYGVMIGTLCAPPGDAVLCGPDAFALLQPEDFEPGNAHPNASGHRKLAEALRAAIVAALPPR